MISLIILMIYDDVYLVIGGEGFLGYHIVNQLVELKKKTPNIAIISFDLDQRYTRQDVKVIKGDICKIEDLCASMQNVTTVFHTASPVASSKKSLFWEVNVKGTQNVIKASLTKGVKNLVYSSSCGVVYDCAPIEYGDESQPYCKKHIDDYNETKAIAEKLVMVANGNKGLKTCCLRLAGLFGPKDRQMIPKLVQLYQNNRINVQVGDNSNLFDYTYIENAANAHLLAAKKLADKDSGVDGEVIIITNDEPIPFWDLPKMVWASLGAKQMLKYQIPYRVALFLSYIAEFIMNLLSVVYKTDIAFKPYAIRYCCCDRYFNIQKARKLLEYKPIYTIEEGVKRTIKHLEDEQRKL